MADCNAKEQLLLLMADDRWLMARQGRWVWEGGKARQGKARQGYSS